MKKIIALVMILVVVVSNGCKLAINHSNDKAEKDVLRVCEEIHDGQRQS